MDPSSLPPLPPGFQIDQQASPFGNRPVIQQQMTPQDNAQLQHTQLENQNFPLQQQATRTNIQQNQQSMQNQRFNQNQGLRQEFNALPEVKNYSVALQSLGTALKAPDTPQGDLAVIYAYAKAADPGSVVREGEMDMANATASLPQQYQAAAQRLTQGKRLPPEVRTGLIETMRQSVGGMRQVYDQQRGRYEALAQQNGFNPQEIVGDPLYDAYRPSEEAYIRAHGGTPVDPYSQREQAPPAPTVTEKGFGIGPNGSTPTQSGEDFRNQLYSAMKSGQIKSPADMKTWQAQYNQSHGTGWSINTDSPETRKAIAAARGGKAFNIEQPVPDISNAERGAGPSFVRGAADVLTSGLRDKIVAAGDALQGNSPFDYQLQRQYAISDYDQQNHPYARLGGLVAGGFALPLGQENTLLSLSGKGGAYGAAYGLGSSRSLEDVPANVALGGVVGAAIPAAIGGVGMGARAAREFIRAPKGEVPPLVDPVTGKLNEPLEQAGPAARVDAAKDFGIDMPMGAAGDRTAAIIERKLDVRPASAGVMNDSRRIVEGQVQNAAENVAGQFGSSRTFNEAGAELQRGAQERIDRGKGVIGKAYAAIPIANTAPASVGNTTAELLNLTGRFQSNPKLAEALHDPKLKQYLDAFQGGKTSWQDLKQFRTMIGEKIGEMRFGESSSISDLRALYGALSEDMRATARAMGSRALNAFERANKLNRQNEELVQGALTRILGKDGQLAPEKAAAAIQTMTKGGKSTGDLKTLAQIRAATQKSGAWDEVAGTLIRIGGSPADSPGRGFDPKTFVQWYSDMSEQARSLLFKPQLRQSLDKFVMVNQRLANSNALRNTSNTAMASPTGTFGIPSAVALLFTGHPVAAAGLVVGTGLKTAGEYGMAELWTNPKFVQWATGYSRAAASGSASAVKSQVGRLTALATANPELREGVEHLLKKIANDNSVSSVAASPNADPNQQNNGHR